MKNGIDISRAMLTGLQVTIFIYSFAFSVRLMSLEHEVFIRLIFNYVSPELVAKKGNFKNIHRAEAPGVATQTTTAKKSWTSEHHGIM